MPRAKQLNKHFSDDDLRRIVAKQLPAWKRACAASGATAIVLHESAFGRSNNELLLLACAIKYAALSKKTIHIASGEHAEQTAPEFSTRKDSAIRTFHEKAAHHTRGQSRRSARS
jgi:hypothetical protein